MPHWTVSYHDESATLESEDWEHAVRDAAPTLGLAGADLDHLRGGFEDDGFLHVRGLDTGEQILVRDVPEDMVDETMLQLLQLEGDDARAEPDDLAERMFDLSERLYGCASASEVSAVALELLREVVGAESGSVLLSDGQGLSFVAAYGPRSEALSGRRIRYSFGLSGYTHATGRSVVAEDVQHDARHRVRVDNERGYPRHHTELDDELAYHPRAILAVSVADSRGRRYGALELLDTRRGFCRWELAAAEGVAHTIGEWIATNAGD